MLHCSPAVHADGSTEYDAHNLYGTTMAMRFHAAFTAITGKRPFILSRYACACKLLRYMRSIGVGTVLLLWLHSRQMLYAVCFNHAARWQVCVLSALAVTPSMISPEAVIGC